MKCYKCNYEFTYSDKYSNIDRIFKDEFNIEIENINDFIITNEHIEQIFQIILKSSYDIGYYEYIANLLKGVNILCPICNEPNYCDYYLNYGDKIYIGLQERNRIFIYSYFSKKLGVNYDELLKLLDIITIYNPQSYVISIIQKNDNEKFKQINRIVEITNKFYDSRCGGGNEFDVISYIHEFVSSELVKNIIYDLLKFGSISALFGVKKLIFKHKVKSMINSKMNEIIDNSAKYSSIYFDVLGRFNNAKKKNKRKMFKMLVECASDDTLHKVNDWVKKKEA